MCVCVAHMFDHKTTHIVAPQRTVHVQYTLTYYTPFDEMFYVYTTLVGKHRNYIKSVWELSAAAGRRGGVGPTIERNKSTSTNIFVIGNCNIMPLIMSG